MKPFFLFLLSFVCMSAYGSPSITVNFVNPDHFTDVKDSYMGSDRGRDATLHDLRQYIVHKAGSRLRDSDTLIVNITDIDLAGEFIPGTRHEDVRVIKDIYPPRINLSYQLKHNGETVSAGERQLRNMDFLMTASPITSMDSLRYEKDLLNSWIEHDIPKTHDHKN